MVAPGIADLHRLGIVLRVEVERFVDVASPVDAEDSILLPRFRE